VEDDSEGLHWFRLSPLSVIAARNRLRIQLTFNKSRGVRTLCYEPLLSSSVIPVKEKNKIKNIKHQISKSFRKRTMWRNILVLPFLNDLEFCRAKKMELIKQQFSKSFRKKPQSSC
jgi:hypothetical protein